MKIYAFSGLGADKRVFQFLEIDHEIIPIDWIKSEENESIERYSKRIAEGIDKQEDFILLGVSFGGLIAIELAKFLQPKALILISSIATYSEIPFAYKIVGKIGLMKLIPDTLFVPSAGIAQLMFQAENKELLSQILKSTDADFAKWASNCLMNWKNTRLITPTIRIHGTRDRLLKPVNWEGIHKIEKGTHFMIVDCAKEISVTINRQINEIFEK